MKKILSILTLAVILIACGKAEETHADYETKRIVRPAWGVNHNIKVIRWMDTMYQVGDTIRLDMRGLSSIPEAIIVK